MFGEDKSEDEKRREYQEYLKQFYGLAYKPMSYHEWLMRDVDY